MRALTSVCARVAEQRGLIDTSVVIELEGLDPADLPAEIR